MKSVDWDKVRREDGSINLIDAYKAIYTDGKQIPEHYLQEIEVMHPIRSRQAAACAIRQARESILSFERFPYNLC